MTEDQIDGLGLWITEDNGLYLECERRHEVALDGTIEVPSDQRTIGDLRRIAREHFAGHHGEDS